MRRMKVQINPIARETDRAYGIDLGENTSRQYGTKTVQVSCLTWFPKSQAQIEIIECQTWITVPEWLGKKYGLQYAIKHGLGEYVGK